MGVTTDTLSETLQISDSVHYPLPFRLALNLKGALHVLGLRKYEPLLPRLLFMGADPGDALRTLSAIRSPHQWATRWSQLGLVYEQQGQTALKEHDVISAADAFRLAAIYFRIAEYMVRNHHEKVKLWRKLQYCYVTAGRFFTPPLDVLTIRCQDLHIPLYLRIPVSEQSVPCIITLGGVDGVKEEWYQITQKYIERGWACVTLDLPGQGELRRLSNYYWRPDAEHILSAVLDALEKLPDIDNTRIALIGGSAGGYFALRAAACDRRIRACALISAPVSLADVYRTAPMPIPQTIDYNLGSDSREESLCLLQSYNAEPLLPQICCPLWLVHGGQDTTVRPWHAQLIKKGVRGPVTEVYYPAGDHICFNYLADWQIQLHSWLNAIFRK